MGATRAGMRLAAHHQIDLGAVRREGGFDIAHGDGRIQAGPEAAAGDRADDAAGLVGDLGAFARGRAAIGPDADALVRRAVEDLVHDLFGGRKILVELAALADGPDQIGFGRIGGLVDVMAVKAKPRFEPQAVARAKPDGQHFGFAQQRARDAFRIRCLRWKSRSRPRRYSRCG